MSWAFATAGARLCAVSPLSLGHHLGAHDGTDAEEHLHAQLTGLGQIVVVAAGNSAPTTSTSAVGFSAGSSGPSHDRPRGTPA